MVRDDQIERDRRRYLGLHRSRYAQIDTPFLEGAQSFEAHGYQPTNDDFPIP